MVRRLGAVAAAVALVASGCSTSKPAKQAAAPTPSTTTTTEPPAVVPAVVDQEGCRGLGTVPVGGEVTWTIGQELWSTRGCLLKFREPRLEISWNGAGDHLLVGHRLVLTKDGPVPMEPPARGWDVWSRPAGKALLFMATTDGRPHLFKQPLEQPPVDVTFLHATGFAIYHPAGRHLVAAGEHGGFHGLFIADNEGRDLRGLADGEEAEITDAAFTASGALLFLAKHDGQTHLHRLEFDPSNLTTLATFPVGKGPSALVTSPFSGGGVAYSSDRTLWASRDGKVLPTKGTAVEHATPVGWLPDSTLVAVDNGDLFTFKDGTAERIGTNVAHAAVRAAAPPPPAPPKDIPSEAPS